jgi:hypothetical protein
MSIIKSFSIKAKGASHIKDNKVCQDFADSYPVGNTTASKFAIVAVSDGHGGDKYFRSDRGAELAVEKAILCVQKCMFTDEFYDALKSKTLTKEKKDEYIINLEESIIRLWNSDVKKDINNVPFADDEINHLDNEYKSKLLDTISDYKYKTYGATLIVGVVCDDFWFGFQIGDGTFVIKKNGVYEQPIELDPKCVGVNVTSICNNNAINYFHHKYDFGMPEAVFIASDGVDESFATVEGLYKFYDNIILNSCDDWASNVNELEAYLPELSAKGSRDDVSLAAIINIDRNETRFRLAEEVISESSKESGSESSEQSSFELSEKADSESSVEVSSELLEKTSSESLEETSSESSEETNSVSSEEISSESSEEISSETSEETNSETSAETNSETSAETNSETSEETNSETSEETISKTSEETNSESSEKTNSESSEKTSSESSEEIAPKLSEAPSLEVPKEADSESSDEEGTKSSREMGLESSEEISSES